MDDPEIPPAGSNDGSIRRRDLIRRAAILGAAAWTVPVVVESLVSPAGALTIGPGCSRMYLEFSTAGAAWPGWQSTAPADGTCVPSGSCTPTASTAPSAGVSISPSTQPANNSTTTVSITIPAETNCTVVGASAWVIRNGVNACASATASGTSSGVTFTFASGGVSIAPGGAAASNTFWDQSGTVRSFIGVVISCT